MDTPHTPPCRNSCQCIPSPWHCPPLLWAHDSPQRICQTAGASTHLNPLLIFPLKIKRTGLVTREAKFPSPYWSSMQSALLLFAGMDVGEDRCSYRWMPHVQPVWNNSSLTRCSVVPLCQRGGSPRLPSGRHCWRRRDLLSPGGISPASPSAWTCLPAQCQLWALQIREQQVPTALIPARLQLCTSALGPSTTLPDKETQLLAGPCYFS